MKNVCFAAVVMLAGLGAGCESYSQTPGASGAVSSRNVIESNGFRLVMNWCAVNPDRSAECQLTATSLTQDFKAGFSYPILQDQDGAQYRMVPTDGGLGQYTMIAGEPYVIRYKNQSILPTTVDRVRGVVGTWSIANLQGIKAGAFPVTFADIPVKPVVAPASAPAAAAEAADAVPVAAPISGSVADTYWHGIIVPVVAIPEDDVVRLWKRGAYIHFREDGAAGYNWSAPGPYIYDPVNKWSQDGAKFTLEMSGARYTFDPDLGDAAKLEAFLEPGGAFKMTMARKDKGAQ